MTDIRLAIIGGGMMGRLCATTLARWSELREPPSAPCVHAVCSRSPSAFDWFHNHCPQLNHCTDDIGEILADPRIDACYIATPHDSHREFAVAAIDAGKHLMLEKPAGIDSAAHDAIAAAAIRRPDVIVRCFSQFPFYPGAQAVARTLHDGDLGRLIELRTAFLHSSDLDVGKAINWKRRAAINGSAGVLNDLGVHCCTLPLQTGIRPLNVRAILSDLVTERPDRHGDRVACDTWDNAHLLIEAEDRYGHRLPWNLRAHRIAPGERNSWKIEALGMRGGIRFDTRNPQIVERLRYTSGGDQAWERHVMGSQGAYPTLTGAIFEFGFSDALLQMWAAWSHAIAGTPPPHPAAACPELMHLGMAHALFAAALQSQASGATVSVS